VLAAVARGDESKAAAVNAAKSMPYQVITREGGPDLTINGLPIKFPKAADYLNTIRAQFASVKQK